MTRRWYDVDKRGQAEPVGRAMLREDASAWEQDAYRPERHDAGKRKDEWLATAPTEAGCVAEMAR